ncbi:Nose resistant to fluoxetine protein 6 [Halotydeus destructor]|nr:Nose resistant to fluoxetine protein 6 [Halotydeus destructor]
MASPSADHLFLSYLENWVKLFNETMQLVPSFALSSKCSNHLNQLINDAHNNQIWALKMLDAMGKPTSGIMEAHLSFLGSYSECVEVRSQPTVAHTSGQFTGQYCMGHVQLPNAALSSLQKLSGLSPSILSGAHPRIGLCVPSTCDRDEIELLSRTALNLLIENATVSVTNCYEEGSSGFSNDNAAHIVLYVFAICLIPILIGTAYDILRPQNHFSRNLVTINNNNYKDYMSPSMAVHVNSHRPRTTTGSSVASLVTSRSRAGTEAGHMIINNARLRLRQLLVAFSIKSNAAKIISTEENSLSINVLHGLRVVMMLWIISGHSYSFAMQWLFFQNPQKLTDAPKNVMSQLIANGTFSVDSFFFISGLLVTLMALKTLRRSRGKFNLLYYYVHRYLRMTPLMMVVIGYCATLLRYTGHGPGWRESIAMYDGWCRSNWWLNALYLHNFFDRTNMCLSHSWYSAVDMQLYIMAPIVIIPLYKKPKLGLSIVAAILATSMAITAYLTFTNNFPAVPYINDLVPQDIVNEYYGAIYIKPYTRVGPYLVGMVLGYILYTMDGKLHLSQNQSRLGWLIATVANLGVLFAMAPANMGYLPSPSMAALYSATSRTIWASSLAWITYACIAGRGGFMSAFLSWKIWVPMSRLTYAAYLVHPVVMASFYGSRQMTFEFSHFLMLYLTLGNLVLTYVVAFLLSAIFESPIVALEKLFLRKLASGSR